MGKVRLLQSMLNAGELNPLTKGRSDTPRYHQGLELCRNAIPLVTGGVTGRGGFRFVARAAHNACRLIPLRINLGLALQGYVLEFTENKLRYHANNAQVQSSGVAVETTTDFLEDELYEIKYEQFENILYLAHTSHPTSTVKRNSATSWTLADIEFASQPSTDLWSDTNGYPGAITFFEQRMILAGSKLMPTTVWGSASADFLTYALERLNTTTNEMEPATLDNDPYQFTPAAASTRINHLQAEELVNIFTFDKQLSMGPGSNSSALTPSNVQFKTRTNKNIHPHMRPLSVDGDIFFSSLSGKRFRLFSYRFDKDRYVSPDYGVFGAHLIEQGGGIAEAVYASEPHSCIWAVTNNGHLLAFVYDPDQEIYAWSRHYTAENTFYQSVCVIPGPDGQDQVWIAVDRTINNETVTCIEYLDLSLNTDSAMTATSAEPTTTWSGFDHLEGQTVTVKGDGVVMSRVVVQDGIITTNFEVSSVEVGLPYTVTIKDLPPDLANPGTTMQGTSQSIKNVYVRLYESMGCSINGEVIPFRQFGVGVLDTPLPPFSGIKEVSQIGWSDDPADSQITITQEEPLPITVLSIIKEIEVNG